MENSVSIIFELPPKQWGLRGDPYLWEELQQYFKTISLPCSEASFMQYFASFFQEITNRSFKGDSNFFVEKYARGGMSSGCISLNFWKEQALPLLISNLQSNNKRIGKKKL